MAGLPGPAATPDTYEVRINLLNGEGLTVRTTLPVAEAVLAEVRAAVRTGGSVDLDASIGPVMVAGRAIVSVTLRPMQ